MAHVRDTIVVGAGPAGSSCAQTLASGGHDVLLLERDRVAGDSANCTGIVGVAALAEMAVPAALHINEISSLLFVGPDESRLDYDHGAPLAQIVRRRELDHYLARRAVDHGAVLRTGVEVTRIERERDLLVLTLRSTAGKARELERIHSRAVVLAVGYRPPLLRDVGLREPSAFVQAAQLLCPIADGSDESLFGQRRRALVFVGERHAPGSFGWAAHVAPGWVKVGVATHRRALQHLRALVEHPLLRRSVRPELGRLRTSPIPVGPALQTVADRVLVVGEAAGQVKTTSHGGIYYGALGGRLAAQFLGAALACDDLSAAGLNGYEIAWRRLLERELSQGFGFRNRALRLTDRQISRLMRLAAIPGVMRLVRAHADFDWHAKLLGAVDDAKLLEVGEPTQGRPGLPADPPAGLSSAIETMLAR